MRPALKLLLNTPPVIPNALKPYLLSWHDAQRQMGVYFPLTNLVSNGDFSNGTTGWSVTGGASLSVTDNILSAVGNGTAASISLRFVSTVPIVDAHKILFRCKGKASADGVALNLRVIGTGGGDNLAVQQLAFVADTWYALSGIATIASSSGTIIFSATFQFADAATANGKTVSLDGTYGVLTTELTTDLGSGREPTAAEMDAILTADGTTYWDGARTVHCNPVSKYFWYDYSGNSRHMYLGNKAWAPLSTLSAANGDENDGVDDYGVIADSAATRLTTGGTLAAWIYPIGLEEAAGGRIFDKGTSTAAANGFFLCVSTDNVLRFYVNAGAAFTDSANNAITLNKWQQATVTFDSTGRHLYVNGMDVTASGGTTTALPPDVAGVVTIGNRAGATDRTFNGYIDRPMIFNRVLSQAEVMALYRGSRRRYGV